MTRVVIFFNRGYLPTHMNYHDMITFRLRYTHVYTLKVLPFVPYTDMGFILNLVSLISEGYKNIALASYSPMWQYHRRVAMKALRLVYTERLVTNFFFFLSSHCLTTVMLHVYNVSEWSNSLKTKSSSETRHEHFVILLFDHRYTINVIMIFEACQMWNH